MNVTRLNKELEKYIEDNIENYKESSAVNFPLVNAIKISMTSKKTSMASLKTPS